jgi:hypothetical protein
MAVRTTDRKAVVIEWDPRDYDGDVVIEATGAEGDVHTAAPVPNDGDTYLSYPSDFTGESKIRILAGDDSGDVIDEGTIAVY